MITWLHQHALGLGVALVWLLAIYSAMRAIMHTRTAQGAAAWVLALLLMPFLTLPVYWIFGHTKFQGYVSRRQRRMMLADEAMAQRDQLEAVLGPPEGRHAQLHTLARRLGAGGFTRGNRLHLLIDGEATFDAMLAAIAQAQDSVLIQFYIFRDDGIGRRIQQALMERARAGVCVCMLYDEVGSRPARKFLDELAGAGVQCHLFNPNRRGYRFQFNFRNHRKVLVVDGRLAFLGGINIGDDYLGKYEKIGPWRDTHMSLEGPAAAQAQVAFFKDWYWATDELPRAAFNLQPAATGEDDHALVWHTGPADAQPEALLQWLALINAARERIWIANPYFVPPEPILQALRLALVRGVQVRLLLPGRSDNLLVQLASQTYLADMIKSGAAVYQWHDGFMHQKTCLIDDDLAMIGSTNLDNRSIFINFEISALLVAPEFVEQVTTMLEMDFARARQASIQQYHDAGMLHRLLCRAANMLAPML